MEIKGIRDVHKFAFGVARRFAQRGWIKRFIEFGRLTLDELAHEALVGIWLASQTECPADKEVLWHYHDSARSRMDRFIRDQFGIWRGFPERIFQIPQNKSGEEMEFTALSRDEEMLLGGNLLEIARGVLLANRRKEQGQRDWKVLRLFLLSYKPEEIVKACPWFTNPESAARAIQRIILELRQVFGGDLTKAIYTSIRKPKVQERRTLWVGKWRSEYDKQYYARNADKLRKRAKKRMQEKRAAAKKAKAAFERLFEPGSEEGGGNISCSAS